MKIQHILNEEDLNRQQKMPHLYLDMDGVQCDFFTAWAQWHNKKFSMDHVERYKDIGSKEQREQSIKELNAEGPTFIKNFFATLETLPNFDILYNWLVKNNIPYTILSAPLRGNNNSSIEGKMIWLQNNHTNFDKHGKPIFRGDKERMANKNGTVNVLVDDHKDNIKRWENAGGIGVLYRDNNVGNVISRLEEIYGPYLNK